MFDADHSHVCDPQSCIDTDSFESVECQFAPSELSAGVVEWRMSEGSIDDSRCIRGTDDEQGSVEHAEPKVTTEGNLRQLFHTLGLRKNVISCACITRAFSEGHSAVSGFIRSLQRASDAISVLLLLFCAVQ